MWKFGGWEESSSWGPGEAQRQAALGLPPHRPGSGVGVTQPEVEQWGNSTLEPKPGTSTNSGLCIQMGPWHLKDWEETDYKRSGDTFRTVRPEECKQWACKCLLPPEFTASWGVASTNRSYRATVVIVKTNRRLHFGVVAQRDPNTSAWVRRSMQDSFTGADTEHMSESRNASLSPFLSLVSSSLTQLLPASVSPFLSSNPSHLPFPCSTFIVFKFYHSHWLWHMEKSIANDRHDIHIWEWTPRFKGEGIWKGNPSWASDNFSLH